MPDPTRPVPPQIAGYQIESLLGQGAMGQVYRARKQGLERAVALKVLKPEVSAQHERVERFLLEARALAGLDHPSIVTLYDAGRSGSTVYFTMELVDGPPLSAVVAAGPPPLAWTIDIALQSSSALAHAHAHGIVHRDIKPENIVVSRAGQANILDFGLARLQTESVGPAGGTQVGRVMGTPNYMAPEQRTDATTVGPSADIYSFGLVIAELVTGKTAQLGKIDVEQIHFRPLRELVASMLAADPVQRPTAAAVEQTLRQLQREPHFKLASWSTKRKLGVLAVALLFVRVVFFLGLAAPASRLVWDLSICLASPERLPAKLSLVDVGPPPVDRQRLAEAVRAVSDAGATALMLDVLLDKIEGDSGPLGKPATAALCQALASSGRAVVACDVGSERIGAGREPLAEVARSVAAVGFGNFYVDPDRVARSVAGRPASPSHAHQPLAVAAALVAKQRGLPLALDPASLPGRLPIHFRADGMSFLSGDRLEPALLGTVSSMHDLLGVAGGRRVAGLKDHVVLFGSLDPDTALAGDVFPTPFDRMGRRAVCGLWLHAAILAGLLDGRAGLIAGVGATVALALVGALLPLLAAWLGVGRRTTHRALAIVSGMAVVGAVAAWSLAGWMIDPLALVVGQLATLLVLAWTRPGQPRYEMPLAASLPNRDETPTIDPAVSA